MSSSFPSEAICKKGLLCNFVTIFDNEEVLKETCKDCAKTFIFNRICGKIDERLYARAHYRDIIQPFGQHHEMFIKCYGNEAIEHAKSIGKQQQLVAGTAKRKQDYLDEYRKEIKISSKTFF